MPLDMTQRVDRVMQREFYSWYIVQGMTMCGLLAVHGVIMRVVPEKGGAND